MLRNSMIRVHWKFATSCYRDDRIFTIYFNAILDFFNRYTYYFFSFFFSIGFSRYFLIEMNFDPVIDAMTAFSTLLNRLRGNKCRVVHILLR